MAGLPAGYEVWWLDTKDDPKDRRALRHWGFRNGASEDDLRTTKIPNAKYFLIESRRRSDGKTETVANQSQKILRAAYKQTKVLVVVDEYTQVTTSRVSAGPALHDVFTRGGGRNVGIIGLTQEPVNIPRLLLSQATHLVVFNLTFQYDIEYIQKGYIRDYKTPMSKGNPWGFYWLGVDSQRPEPTYYTSQSEWYDDLSVQILSHRPVRATALAPSPEKLEDRLDTPAAHKLQSGSKVYSGKG
jgi:hypothetical protein